MSAQLPLLFIPALTTAASFHFIFLKPVDKAIAGMLREDRLQCLGARGTDQAWFQAGVGKQLERRRDWRMFLLELWNTLLLYALGAGSAVLACFHVTYTHNNAA